jgi:hypothetical protein
MDINTCIKFKFILLAVNLCTCLSSQLPTHNNVHFILQLDNDCHIQVWGWTVNYEGFWIQALAKSTANFQSEKMFNVPLCYKMTESPLSFPEFAPLRPITDITKLSPCITLIGNFLLWSGQINCRAQPAFYENVTGTSFPEDKVAGPLIYYSPPQHQG